MIEIIRNRTIRPSSRLETSKSYKINTEKVTRGDSLIVNIDHESKSFSKSFQFSGADVADKRSISFRVKESGDTIDISWSGAQPIGTAGMKSAGTVKSPKSKPKETDGNMKAENIKTSFDCISTPESKILILGTMPGEKSLALGEYYGHPRNRFWKIIAEIMKKPVPVTYAAKKQLLSESKIAVWDVAYQARRTGSLDSAITEEVPNDLAGFIEKHKNLKVIGFNGSLSAKLYDRYFKRNKDLNYFLLPSTSPANTGIDFENICKLWQQILIND